MINRTLEMFGTTATIKQNPRGSFSIVFANITMVNGRRYRTLNVTQKGLESVLKQAEEQRAEMGHGENDELGSDNFVVTS